MTQKAGLENDRSLILRNGTKSKRDFFTGGDAVVNNLIRDHYRIQKQLNSQKQNFRDVILERNTVREVYAALHQQGRHLRPPEGPGGQV